MTRPLLLANLRYWPTVAPVVGRELRRWRARAEAIPNPELKALALAKLRDEHFNARVAATLATLAPLRHRAGTTAAIVAYQLAYDYLDGLTEQPVPEHLQSNRQLYAALTDAVAIGQTAGADYWSQHPQGNDGGYLQALCRTVEDRLARLPAAASIRPAAADAAHRCAESQARVHATGSGDPASLVAWATEQAQSTPLGWREWLAGAVSSVLCVHALIAAAADRTATPPLAVALDDAYLPIAALSTMLDSLVDWREDHLTGRTPWLLSHYEYPADLGEPLSRTASCATARASKLPHAAYHVMTLTGVIAYYTSAPAAAEPHARPAVEHLHRALPATPAPTLAVMRAWRTAQHAFRCIAPAILLAATSTPAIASHTLNVKDHAHLKLVGSHQNTLVETGKAAGTIPGTVKVSFTLHGLHATSRFTIHAKGGALTGVGEGKVKSGKTGYDSFGGSLRLTGGTGRYRDASGSGGLYGSLYKLNESLKVQVYGTLHYR